MVLRQSVVRVVGGTRRARQANQISKAIPFRTAGPVRNKIQHLPAMFCQPAHYIFLANAAHVHEWRAWIQDVVIKSARKRADGCEFSRSLAGQLK